MIGTEEVKLSKSWSQATFSVSSLSRTAAEITAALRVQPSRHFERGERLSRRHPESGPRTESLWLLKSPLSADTPLDEHVGWLLNFIEERCAALKALSSECTFAISCGFSSESGQGGFVLDSSMLLRLTILPIDLVVDLYPPSDVGDIEP